MLCISLFSFLGTVEVINARETVPQVFPHDLLSGCDGGFPIGKGTDRTMRACSAQSSGWGNLADFI